MWPFIDSAPVGHKDMKPVSLEQVWLGKGHRIKIFEEKRPFAGLSKKKDTPLMLFLWEILALFVYMLKKRSINIT